MMFLAFQNTYDAVEIGLFNENNLIASISIDKYQASKQCIPSLDQLLKSSSIVLRDIAFIAVNQGPAPFSTLRIILASANGLSFANQIPLIGIGSLEAFLMQYAEEPYHNKVALLNAFGQDLYFALQSENDMSFGCAPAQSVLLDIQQKMPTQEILFLGNGIDKYCTAIKMLFGDRAVFLVPNPQTVSLAQIGHMGLACWQQQKNISYQLQPAYLKQAF